MPDPIVEPKAEPKSELPRVAPEVAVPVEVIKEAKNAATTADVVNVAIESYQKGVQHGFELGVKSAQNNPKSKKGFWDLE